MSTGVASAASADEGSKSLSDPTASALVLGLAMAAFFLLGVFLVTAGRRHDKEQVTSKRKVEKQLSSLGKKRGSASAGDPEAALAAHTRKKKAAASAAAPRQKQPAAVELPVLPVSSNAHAPREHHKDAALNEPAPPPSDAQSSNSNAPGKEMILPPLRSGVDHDPTQDIPSPLDAPSDDFVPGQQKDSAVHNHYVVSPRKGSHDRNNTSPADADAVQVQLQHDAQDAHTAEKHHKHRIRFSHGHDDSPSSSSQRSALDAFKSPEAVRDAKGNNPADCLVRVAVAQADGSEGSITVPLRALLPSVQEQMRHEKREGPPVVDRDEHAHSGVKFGSTTSLEEVQQQRQEAGQPAMTADDMHSNV